MNASINLLRTSAVLTPELEQLLSRLRIIALLVLAGVGSISLLVVIGYGTITALHTQAKANEERYTKEILAQKSKEGLLISLKDRVALVKKQTDVTHAWKSVFATILGISETSIFEIRTSEDEKVSILFEPLIFEDVVTIVRAAEAALQQKKIHTASLSTFELTDTGLISFGLSFVPQFTK